MGSSGHGEGALGVFWAWVDGATSNMALAFEGLVEQVQSWTVVGGLSGLGLSSTMDTLNTLLIGWMIFSVLIFVIGSFFWVHFVRQLKRDAVTKALEASNEDETGLEAPVDNALLPARKPTIVPDGPLERPSVPVATGADPDAVVWTNNIFTWLYNSPDAGPAVRKILNDTVNDNTVRTALETGILVEVMEIYPISPAPILSNMVVDCSPTDNMTITCDLESTIYLRIVTTRTQREVTTESEYACAVTSLRGRLNIAIVTEELMAVVKFDGWPEVSLEIEGIRNNATGLDEQTMQDVIYEVVTSSLRNSVYDVNFQPIQTFPRFRRARQAPERVIPVGYDSMVRELQTHPPPAATKPKAALKSVHHDEEIEEAGESFTAISFPSSLIQQICLTTSEEHLIQNSLNKYPSLENEMTFCHLNQSWESNYVPASDEHPVEETLLEEPQVEEVPVTPKIVVEPTPELVITIPEEIAAPVEAPALEEPVENEAPEEVLHEPLGEEELSEKDFILMVSSRRKMIDEPRHFVTVEEVHEEKEEVPVPHPVVVPQPVIVPRPVVVPHPVVDEEPCLRRGGEASPLRSILSQPKVEEPIQIEEEVDEELDIEELDFMDKNLNNTSGTLPALSGLSKGPFALQSSTTGQPLGIPGLNGKRLLVKIVKAAGVGCEKSVSEAYAVVEMDEPSQKFTTSVIKDTSSPFWDEQFLFDLSDGTLELLFELYDKKDGNFLGLGIVGIEELVATPSQRQIIPLQPRPYENDEVSGSLTVEFLFLDRADIPDLTLRSSATRQSVSPKGDLVTTTTTTYTKAPESQDVIVNGGDGVAAAALRDIEDKNTIVANNANKSTMIIHASRKVDDEEDYNEIPAQDLATLTTTATTTTPTITTNQNAAPATTQSPLNATSTDINADVEAEIDERGRSRGNRRKRDSFFGTLKKRFSRSKVRSKSVDPNSRDMSTDRDMSVGRSISMERTAAGLLAVPKSTGDGGSTRSSLSDASAISSSSTRTYINEASTLIVEIKEDGVLKHYLIPLSLQQKSKWRKKGVKLHVFGEHIFVAKHMSSSTPCQVCQKTLGRRFGKQGYECRDCGFKCHKPCHVKTDTVCPNSTVNTMDIEYVKDPREERRAWMKKVKTS